jgi:hypothetical protein
MLLLRWKAVLEIEGPENEHELPAEGGHVSRFEIILGYFHDEMDAAWVHDTAARMQYGDAAQLNTRDSKDKKLNAKRKVAPIAPTHARHPSHTYLAHVLLAEHCELLQGSVVGRVQSVSKMEGG